MQNYRMKSFWFFVFKNCPLIDSCKKDQMEDEKFKRRFSNNKNTKFTLSKKKRGGLRFI